MTTHVAVVTVSYGSQDVLGDFLASVPRASTCALRTIVADNDPEHGEPVRELVRIHGAVYLDMRRNTGYGSAIDTAVGTLPPDIEWILVSNPDVRLGEGSIDALVHTAMADERIGAVGPAVLTPDGEVYPSARAIPSLRTGIGHALFANVWKSNPWTRAYRKDTELPPRPRDAGWLSGSCLLIRRRAFEDIDGFDRGYFMYFEDVDLGYRLGHAGWRNIYEPEAIVTHTGAHSTDRHSADMIRAHHRSAYRFLASKYHGWWLWPVRVVLRVGLAVRGWWVAARGRHR